MIFRSLLQWYLRVRYSRYIKYISVAEDLAERLSKGRNTRVGALILDKYRNVKAIGYNGAPRGCSADDLDDSRSLKPEKLHWVAHAEANAICNAAMSGTSTARAIMVVTHIPCMECAILIAQAGIKVVISQSPTKRYLAPWNDSMRRTKLLFKEVGVDLVIVPNIKE